MQSRHRPRRCQRVAFLVEQLVVTHGVLKLGATYRISLIFEPLDVASANLEHAAHSNGVVLQLLIDLVVDAARQQSIRAPGEDDRQERECYSLLEREPGTQPA